MNMPFISSSDVIKGLFHALQCIGIRAGYQSFALDSQDLSLQPESFCFLSK